MLLCSLHLLAFRNVLCDLWWLKLFHFDLHSSHYHWWLISVFHSLRFVYSLWDNFYIVDFIHINIFCGEHWNAIHVVTDFKVHILNFWLKGDISLVSCHRLICFLEKINWFNFWYQNSTCVSDTIPTKGD